MTTVCERGEFHGRITLLAMGDLAIHVGLQKADGSVINCTATVEQARGLKPYLLEPIDVLVTGVGRWARTDEGHWDVSDFRISDFSPLQYDGLDEALAKVRSGGSGWDSEPDIDAALHRIRYGRIAGEPD